jgi:anti-sigma factor RsiW
MKQAELDLLHGYLDGTISDVDFAELQSLLRESAEARRTLRALATVDAKLQELAGLSERTMELLGTPPPPPSRARSHYDLLAWSSLAAAAACVALALTGMLLTRDKSSRPRPDVAAAISSTQEAIARLSIDLPPLFPAWASATASMLDQPRIPK